MMARKNKTDKEVLKLINDLSRIFTGIRTVNGLSDLLKQDSNSESFSSFHVNRINGFLDGLPNRAINAKTFNAVLNKVDQLKISDYEDLHFKDEVISRFRKYVSSGINEEDAFNKTSIDLSIPKGVVVSLNSSTLTSLKKAQKKEPDWSWQEVAINKCIDAIKNNKGKNNGLVVPTAGGKTHIAARALCKLIKEGSSKKVTSKDTIKPRVIIQPKSIIGLIPLKTKDKKAHIVVSTV